MASLRAVSLTMPMATSQPVLAAASRPSTPSPAAAAHFELGAGGGPAGDHGHAAVSLSSAGSDESDEGAGPAKARGGRASCRPDSVPFELASAALVVCSAALVVVQTLPAMNALYEADDSMFYLLANLDLLLAAFFLLEYVARLVMAGNAYKYACSFFGVVDACAAVSIVFDVLVVLQVGELGDRKTTHVVVIVRAIRLLRIFRVLKLMRYVQEAELIAEAFGQESRALLVFLLFVLIVLLFLGSALYLTESGRNGFESIPMSVWWATVTLTTVGYGDLVPSTVAGRLIACVLMLTGYSILAVPTIVGVLGSTAFKRDWASIGAAGVLGRTSNPEASAVRKAFVASADVAELAEAGPRGQYPFLVTLAVRPGDVDRHGYLRSTGCHELIEAAVHAFLSKEASWGGRAASGTQAEALRPLVVASSCRLAAPLPQTAGLEAGVALESVEGSTCTYRVGLFQERGGALCAAGRLTHLWFDGAARGPSDVPCGVLRAAKRSQSGSMRPPLARRLSNLAPTFGAHHRSTTC